MEIGFVVVVSKKSFITTLLLITTSSTINATEANKKENSHTNSIEKKPSSTVANELQTIRFYRANKHQQKIRLTISKNKSSETGCHNFKRSRRIATIVQIGYQACSIYTKKNCDTESIIRANHSGQDAFSELLTEGHGWLPKPQSKKDRRGVKLRSWSCQ